uniref:BED-type domain-containing protein n=1 Tax=Sparus aurata TaxID=8175 RepID=A0A671WJW0_SPAAU
SKESLTGWTYAHYFQFLRDKDVKNIIATCTLCVKPKDLSTSRNNTSNLTKHLERCHTNIKLVTKRKQTEDESGEKTKQQKHSPTVAEYVVEVIPIILLLMFMILLSGLRCMLDNEPNQAVILKVMTDSIKHLGVTVHWIDSTLKRNKAALACKRIRGRHTYDVIGAEIEEIHSSYGLHGKVVATVTDNASNFAKAFRVCQPCHLDSESENEEGDDEDPTFTDVIEALSTASGDGQFSLPPHYRCASQTINLISTSDVDKHLSSCADTKAVHRSSFAKCSALWTKASRSTLASEQVEEVNRRKLMVPTSTRWNSLYEAISRIITIPMNELNPLCVKLGIKCLNEREYLFLQEYCTVMKPLTVALDILQGDECTYGALLPTLTIKITNLYSKINTFLVISYCILQAIKIRFDAVLDSQEGLLAAATCPKFKLRWLRDERRREHVKELLTKECRKAAPAADNANVSQLAASPAEIDFFDFENQPTESFSAEKEVTDYLRSGYELEILNQFPNLKKMYMKYNSPTPSSAPVERLFSLGGLVLSPKRNRLCDRRFEKLLLMRYNHCFTPKENKKTQGLVRVAIK